jgi:hypothetical protein
MRSITICNLRLILSQSLKEVGLKLVEFVRSREKQKVRNKILIANPQRMGPLAWPSYRLENDTEMEFK